MRDTSTLQPNVVTTLRLASRLAASGAIMLFIALLLSFRADRGRIEDLLFTLTMLVLAQFRNSLECW